MIREVLSQRAGLLGVVLLLILVTASVITPTIYGEYYSLWKDTDYWAIYPKAVPPSWINYFSSQKLPETEVIGPSNVTSSKVYGVAKKVTLVFSIDYHYDVPPQDLLLKLNSSYQSPPAVVLIVKRPDGTAIKLLQTSASQLQEIISINTLDLVKNSLYSWLLEKGANVTSPSAIIPSEVIFKELDGNRVLKGKYEFVIEAIGIGNFTLDCEMILEGKVYGLLGTDVFGRDLFIYLALGLPYGMLVGILSSLIASLIGTIYGLVSGYFGGITDKVMQRVLETWYSIPALPLLIMAAIVFKPSIWLIIVFISIFAWMGVAKVIRSMTLQVKNSTFVIAARASGATNKWIMFKHILPQLLPYTMAQVALGVPGAIITELSLDFLGLGDPNVPTWGWILHDANVYGAAVNGYWWWIAPPGLMAAILGLTFALIGYAMDVVLNPRLRE